MRTVRVTVELRSRVDVSKYIETVISMYDAPLLSVKPSLLEMKTKPQPACGRESGVRGRRDSTS